MLSLLVDEMEDGSQRAGQAPGVLSSSLGLLSATLFSSSIFWSPPLPSPNHTLLSRMVKKGVRRFGERKR